jgi:O-acetyl-ADP-ribose deacetylase (regulator of RNase III)
MAVKFETGNITKVATDAIVNAANSGLQRGGGVCGAIFDAVKAVGGREAYDELTAACNAMGHCSPGNAVITPSFGLPATHIIHAVGPIWSGNKNAVDHLDGGQSNHIRALADTYRSIIRVCRENNLTSVTVPAISAGIYGFPEDLAAAIAVKVCMEESGDIDVTLIGFNSDNTLVLMNTPSPRAATLLSGLTL